MKRQWHWNLYVALPNSEIITVGEVLEEVVKTSKDCVAATVSSVVDPDEVLDTVMAIMGRYKIQTKILGEEYRRRRY